MSNWFSLRKKALTPAFCFPHAAGSGGAFGRLIAVASSNIEIVPITLPGRLHRSSEKSITDLFGLVKDVASEIMLSVEGNIILIGHSLGGVIAFELARWLTTHSAIKIKHLVIVACEHPKFHDSKLYGKRAMLEEADFREMAGKNYEGFEQIPTEFHEIRTLSFNALREDLKLAASYEYKESEPLKCPITVILGKEDSTVRIDKASVWEASTRNAFELKIFQGRHLFLQHLSAEEARDLMGIL